MAAGSETWKVGILFSRSGVTEITETEHFYGTVLAIEEINAAGGILGRQIEPVVYDPGADSRVYRSQARQMFLQDDIDVIFGCSMSASRKAVLPIIERHNGLLFYPSMYEGFEYSENVLYTGATLNQTTFPLAEFILQECGRNIYLVGSDYIYPRESNRVMRDLIESKGGEVVGERYLPLNADSDALQPAIEDILRLRPDVVFSTIIGTTAREFYGIYAESGIDRRKHPIASLTMAETEIRAIGPGMCSGHILAATYFQTLKNEANSRFVAAFKARFGETATTSIWSEPAYVQVHLYAQALERVGSADAHKISEAVLTGSFEAPEGRVSVDADTRHLWLSPRIGVAREDGLFDLVWESRNPVRPDPYLATSRLEEMWLAV